VRFCRVQHAYESREDRVTAEESRVGELTYTILSGFGHRGLRRAAQRMRDHSQG
jgi:hypothetical protein